MEKLKIWILLAGLIMTFGCVDNRNKWEGPLLRPVSGGGIAISANYFPISSCNYTWEDTEIKSLSTVSEISGSSEIKGSGSSSGSFFLGTGSVSGYSNLKGSSTIGEQIVYYFYVKTNDGGYKLDSEKANKIVIYENSSQIPHKSVPILELQSMPISQIDVPKLYEVINGTSVRLGPNGQFCDDEPFNQLSIKLIVPNGTIIQDYSGQVN